MLAMVKANRDHDDVGGGGIGLMQHTLQVAEIARIAHRHQKVARPDSQSLLIQLSALADAKLLDVFAYGPTFGGVVLGDGKDGEEDQAEGNARDGGIRLGKQVDDGYGEKHHGDEAEADGDLLAGDVEIQR